LEDGKETTIILRPFKNSLEGCTWLSDGEQDLLPKLTKSYDTEKQQLTVRFNKDATHLFSHGGDLQLIDFYR